MVTDITVVQGCYLADNKACKTIIVKEFKLTPHPSKHEHDFLIDGDPMTPSAVHVRVRHKGLRVFAEAEANPSVESDFPIGKWIEGEVHLAKPGELPADEDDDEEIMYLEGLNTDSTASTPAETGSVHSRPGQHRSFMHFPKSVGKQMAKANRERDEILAFAEVSVR